MSESPMIRAHRTDCAARSEADTAWCLERYQNARHAEPHVPSDRPRPSPLGCFGCSCSPRLIDVDIPSLIASLQGEAATQRARADRAEGEVDRLTGHLLAASSRLDRQEGEIREARKKLGETKPESEGGRSLALCVVDVLATLSGATHRHATRLAQIAETLRSAGFPPKLHEDEPQQVARAIAQLKESAVGQQKRADRLVADIEGNRQRAEVAESREIVRTHERDRAIAAQREAIADCDRALAACEAAGVVNATLALRAESAEHKVAMLEAEVGQAMQRWTDARANWADSEGDLAVAKTERDEAQKKVAHLQCRLTEAKAEKEKWFGHFQSMEKQRDEAREQLAGKSEKADTLGRLWALACTERDAADRANREAREQLGRLEWAGMLRTGQQRPHLAVQYQARTCLLCLGVEPGDSAAHFTADQIGHKPSCWFAKNGSASTHEVLPGVHVSMKTGPDGMLTVSEEDKAKCAAAVSKMTKDGRLVIPKSKPDRPPYHHFHDAFTWALGVDFGFASRTPEPSRPAPKFKVGQRVVQHPYPGTPFAVLAREWNAQLGTWAYQATLGGMLLPEDHLLAAPKFAVGEWVTHNQGSGEVAGRKWLGDAWHYDLVNGLSGHEVALTAQIPQYKHDCAGCVFLGRMGDVDLYRCVGHRGAGSLGPVFLVNHGKWLSMMSVTEECDSPEYTEARRRAKVRNLLNNKKEATK